jgi:HD-like signal output (HDOD) protein
MIDINKKYRTRDGREVRIYATDGGGGYPVQGAIFSKELGWLLATWSMDGCALNDIDHHQDLIEAKPRIQRTMWVNVYPRLSCTGANHSNKKDADQNAACNRIACVKVEIDCEEGEGL